MKRNVTELVFLLDRSGSMAGLESDTIGGFNSMLKKQRKGSDRVYVSTVLFDDRMEVLHDRVPAERVKPLTEKQYSVRGCTALLDAMGRMISHMIRVQKQAGEGRRGKVIFVITTDGLENSSREYSYARIRDMILWEKERYGWEFLFLGANMDAVAEASRFGIGADRAVTFQNDSRGIALNYRVVSETLCRMRQPCAAVGAEWKKEIEEDVKYRGRRRGR